MQDTTMEQETQPTYDRPAAPPRRRKPKKSKRTRALQRKLLVFGVLAGIFLIIFSMGASWGSSRAPKITEEAVTERLQALGELSRSCYHFTNVERFEQVDDFYGWDASEYSTFTLSYEGVVSAAVKPEGVAVEVKGKSITVTLPEPTIDMDGAIRQDSLGVYNTKQGKFDPIELTDFSGFQDNQKPVVEAKATTNGLLFDASDKAKAAAKALVEGLTGGSDRFDIVIK